MPDFDAVSLQQRPKLRKLGIAGVESSIASVAEIFTLQGDNRMRELERRFLR